MKKRQSRTYLEGEYQKFKLKGAFSKSNFLWENNCYKIRPLLTELNDYFYALGLNKIFTGCTKSTDL